MIISFTNHHHGSHQILSRKSKQNHNTWSNRFTSAQILSINRPHRKLLIVEQRNPKTCVTVPLEKDGATLLTVLLNIHARLPFFFFFFFLPFFLFEPLWTHIKPVHESLQLFFQRNGDDRPILRLQTKQIHARFVRRAVHRETASRPFFFFPLPPDKCTSLFGSMHGILMTYSSRIHSWTTLVHHKS